MSTEKRQHPRFQIRVPLYISVEGEIFRKTVWLESKDVSGGGLSFETGREIELNAESRVVVARIGDLAEPALIQGRVARIEQDPATGRFTVAIEFTGFENVSREELIKRIESWR